MLEGRGRYGRVHAVVGVHALVSALHWYVSSTSTAHWRVNLHRACLPFEDALSVGKTSVLESTGFLETVANTQDLEGGLCLGRSGIVCASFSCRILLDYYCIFSAVHKTMVLKKSLSGSLAEEIDELALRCWQAKLLRFVHIHGLKRYSKSTCPDAPRLRSLRYR